MAQRIVSTRAKVLGMTATQKVRVDVFEETRDTPRLLYDRKEAARQLSLSVRSLDYLVANKKLEFRRIGKKVLITHASLVRFSQANHFESVAAT
jgi:excisionase family DNA binding protein